MGKAKGEVKGRVSIDRTFSIEDHRSLWADQDVLGADIPVNQRGFARLKVQSQGLKRWSDIGLVSGYMEQERIDPKCHKEIICGKLLCKGAIVCRRRVNLNQALTKRSGEPRINPALQQFSFPNRMGFDGQIGHDEDMALGKLRDHLGHQFGADAGMNELQPLDFGG